MADLDFPPHSPHLGEAFYQTLLESTRAIPWCIDWKTLAFTYIGPQIEVLLGWPQDSWKSVNDWAERMHPDDRDWAVDYCVSQSKAGTDHEADYRALTRDGQYVWVRDVVHVIRNERGEVESLVGFMFDITERKKVDEKLSELQKELEELSFKDGLTGVGNRRMLDSVLELEWSNARRDRQPISIIMFDIDYFKQYNDSYGHLQGDECLRQVAKTLSKGATRARDFFARYGGEEFMLVLPETDNESAIKVAERCQQLIFKAQIPHAYSPAGQLVTLSMGLATATPAQRDSMQSLIKTADSRLYRAKQSGRNSLISAG